VKTEACGPDLLAACALVPDVRSVDAIMPWGGPSPEVQQARRFGRGPMPAITAGPDVCKRLATLTDSEARTHDE
jgi:hypothetical protein